MSRYIKKTDRDTPWARKVLARNVTITRQARDIFLIYCEGENTEPEYFRSFPVNTETLVEAIGLGMSRTALVQRILQLASEKEMLQGQRNHDPECPKINERSSTRTTALPSKSLHNCAPPRAPA